MMEIIKIKFRYEINIQPLDKLGELRSRLSGKLPDAPEKLIWLEDNEIEYEYKEGWLRFITLEDAMAFKLMWV